jgi:hypothetical protein
MKTKMYILTLLALIIRMTMISQTPVNGAFTHDKNFVLGYAYYTEEERREFSMIEDPSVLLIQADELSLRAAKMKKEAALKRGEEQKRSLATLGVLQQKINVKRLAASELLAYNNRIEFKMMKSVYVDMLGSYDQDDSMVIASKSLLLKAVRSYRFATELREEAYAQRTIAAVLANLHNAEEREMQAIIQVVQAMKHLEKVVPQVMAKR